MQLTLEDLKPQEATFALSEKPEKTFTLKKISLHTQIWLRERFGKEQAVYQKIFQNQSLPEISEIAYHLLKDKSEFPTIVEFQEAIVTQQDRVTLINAMMTTIGISQPLFDKLSKEYDADHSGETQSPSLSTGALPTI